MWITAYFINNNDVRPYGFVPRKMDDDRSKFRIPLLESLIKIMTDNKQLDGWVQAKITKAADYINSVQEYLDNNKQDVDD